MDLLKSLFLVTVISAFVSYASSQREPCSSHGEGSYCRRECLEEYEDVGSASDCSRNGTKCCTPRCSNVGSCQTPRRNGECPNALVVINYDGDGSEQNGDCEVNTKCCADNCMKTDANSFCSDGCPDGATIIGFPDRRCPSYARDCCGYNKDY